MGSRGYQAARAKSLRVAVASLGVWTGYEMLRRFSARFFSKLPGDVET